MGTTITGDRTGLTSGGAIPEGPTNAELQSRRESAVPRGVSTQLPVFAAKAENAEITVDTTAMSATEAAERIVAWLEGELDYSI